MLLTEEEIKIANDINEVGIKGGKRAIKRPDLDETDAGDIAGVDNKLDKPVKRPSVKPEEKQALMDEGNADNSDIDESEDEVILSFEEKEEILRSFAPDELEFLKDNFRELLCPEKYADVIMKIDTEVDSEKLISYLAGTILPDKEEESPDLIGDIIAYTAQELDDFSDFAYSDELGEISERLIDPQHIRRLRLQRRKAAWKMDAKKRARFRKTGAGRIMKRKAKLYMKKYRRRKKAKLKRYGKELGKYNARMGSK